MTGWHTIDQGWTPGDPLGRVSTTFLVKQINTRSFEVGHTQPFGPGRRAHLRPDPQPLPASWVCVRTSTGPPSVKSGSRVEGRELSVSLPIFEPDESVVRSVWPSVNHQKSGSGDQPAAIHFGCGLTAALCLCGPKPPSNGGTHHIGVLTWAPVRCIQPMVASRQSNRIWLRGCAITRLATVWPLR